MQVQEIWRRPLGKGFSEIAVVGDRGYVTFTDGEVDHLAAVVPAVGRLHPGPPDLLSRRQIVARMAEFGAAPTPATDGRLVFVVSPDCKLRALEAGTGKVAWQRDFKAEDNTGPMNSGCWTSPLLEGNLLVVQVNGEPDRKVMAFEKGSGKVVWSAAGVEKATRSSPLVADLAGVRQIVVHDITQDGKGGLYGLRLEDGAQLWSTRFPDAESYSYDTPLLLAGDRVGVVAWSDFRTAAVRRQGEGLAAEPAWKSREIRAEVQPYNPHAVAHGGHVYGFGGEFLVCLDAATGKTVWKEKTYPGSLILVDGHLVVLSQAAGLLRVIEATPAGYREKGRLEVFSPGAPTDTPPSFAGRRLYLRNSEEVVALDVVK